MNEQDKENIPFGLWPSPISASLISQRLRLEDVQFAGDGQTLVWCEGRSAGSALAAQGVDGSSARRDLTSEQNPRGGVGYGGGVFSVSGETVLFANRDGRIYRRGLGYDRPRPITPAFGPSPSGAVASPALSPDGRWVVYVYSDGHDDLLALADSSGKEWPIQLSRGADFYMQPTWHPAGDRLAWVEWDHPNMPWDGTRIQIARLEGSPPRVVDVTTAAGGADSPAQQPLFSPDGRWLCYSVETGEFPDLMLMDLQTGEHRVLVHGDGFEVVPPAWAQGVRSIGWSPSSQRIFYIRYTGSNSSLWVADLATGKSTCLETAPFTSMIQLAVSPTRDAVAMIAAGANQPGQIVVWENGRLQTQVYSTAATYDPAYLPTAKEITWSTTGGVPVHGLYYPPTHPTCTAAGAPPALVHIHGGPTSIANNGFNGEAAYFTSRGYAYVEVNYRGSTGYGRTYREALRQRWGEVDVEDAASCAHALNEQGLADPKRLIIIGGSAGGYTVLNALIHHPGLFKAGICQYGVTNLFALDLDTHKFEAHYNASLVGHLPEAAGRYHAWSPVFHAEAIRDALYIFQGSEDVVVPPSQSEEIVSALRARGTPHKYKVYEGEGHGFRKSENIADYLNETERFLQQQVLFAP